MAEGNKLFASKVRKAQLIGASVPPTCGTPAMYLDCDTFESFRTFPCFWRPLDCAYFHSRSPVGTLAIPLFSSSPDNYQDGAHPEPRHDMTADKDTVCTELGGHSDAA